MPARRTPPRFLTAGFIHSARLRLVGSGGRGSCWLAQFDPKGLTCKGRMEGIHLIGRQRIENTLGPQLLRAVREDGELLWWDDVEPLLELAEWDGRNSALGCVHHHRRFDGHAVSPDAPTIVVPASKIPGDTLEYIGEFGLEAPAEQRFEQAEPGELERLIERQFNPPPLLDQLEASARGFPAA